MLEVINASKTFAKGTPSEKDALNHLSLYLKDGRKIISAGWKIP